MRIKTNIIDHTILLGIAQSIEKLGKRCICKLDPESVQFTIVSDNLNGSQVWCQVSASGVFEDYAISSNNDDTIALEMTIDHLTRTLKSIKMGSEISLRLIKKNEQPFLSFTIKTQAGNGKSFSLLQEVPVRVLAPEEIERIREPPLKVSDVDVHILLPQLLSLKNVVERLKSLSSYMTIAANMRGELQLGVNTDSAEVTTHYKDLINPEINQQEDDQKPASAMRDPNQMAEARIDVKDFFRFLQCHHVHPTNVVCCILEDTAVLLYVYMKSMRSPNASLGALTYYIPAVMR